MYLAMAKRLSDENYFVTDRQVAYYENLAKGGVGLLATGCCVTVPDYPARVQLQPGIYDDKFIPGLKALADGVHKYGAKILIQPIHHGLTNYSCSLDEVKGPDDLSKEDIKYIQKCYVEGTIRAWKAGFDGVEIHAAHNYLNEEFLAPMFNRRTDEYSCFPTENGVRFTTEIIEEIRERCGRDILIGVKINGSDFTDGGITPEIAARAAALCEKSGADLISVSAGGSLTDICYMSGDGRKDEGWKVSLAEYIKKSVSIPVVATGSIRHPEYVEQILREGKCDMVGMGRELLAEPEWINKVAEGREDELRYCINCLTCFIVTGPGQANCAVNPRALRESEDLELKQNGDGRTVAVIGAGPAGLQAAITLAQRGFKPIVFEEQGQIGGMERKAALPDGKKKLYWHVDYFERMVKKLNIDIRFNTKADAGLIQEMNPYAVFICSGSRPIIPSGIPGIHSPHVRKAVDILEDWQSIKNKKIVVAGAGLVGLETAETLRINGNDVTVIDMLPMPAAMPLYLSRAYKYTKESGVQIYMEHRLEKIEDTAVKVTDLTDNTQKEIGCDMVVLSLGVIPDIEEAEKIEKICSRTYRLGDAVKGRRIIDAVQDGFDTAVSLE